MVKALKFTIRQLLIECHCSVESLCTIKTKVVNIIYKYNLFKAQKTSILFKKIYVYTLEF